MSRPVRTWRHWPALLLVAFFVWRAWDRRWISEDGFIHLRVVQNLLAGHGPVFNAGERVEASTSFLWVQLSGLAALLSPVSIEMTLVVVSIVLVVGGLAAAYVASARILRDHGHRGVLLPGGAIVVAPLSVVWDFASSGLDTALTLAWVGLAWAGLVEIARRRSDAGGWAWLVLGLGPVVRPDLVVVSVVVLVGAVHVAGGVRQLPWRRILLWAGTAPVLVQVLRMGYYGAVVPNTVITKGVGEVHWGLGLRFLADFVSVYDLYLPFAVLGLLVAVHLRLRPDSDRSLLGMPVALFLTPVVAGLAHVLFVVRAGGGFMHGRLLLVGLVALTVPFSAVRPRPEARVLVLALGIWFALAATAMRPGYTVLDPEGPAPIADERAFFAGVAGVEHPVEASDYAEAADLYRWGVIAAERAAGDERSFLAALTPRELLVVDGVTRDETVLWSGAIGVSGVRAGLDVHVVDRLGLADPIAARTETVFPRPGHRKDLPVEWAVARHVSPDSWGRVAASSAGKSLEVALPDVEAAAAALECDDVRELVAATTARLTPQRFVSNLLAAPRLTLLEIPRDPQDAQSCRSAARHAAARASSPASWPARRRAAVHSRTGPLGPSATATP